MTIAHQLSAMLHREQRNAAPAIGLKKCRECNRCFNHRGEIVRTPFILVNCETTELCPECYLEYLQEEAQ